MLDLMCAKGREEFYKKCGFTARPNEKLGPRHDYVFIEDTIKTDFIM